MFTLVMNTHTHTQSYTCSQSYAYYTHNHIHTNTITHTHTTIHTSTHNCTHIAFFPHTNAHSRMQIDKHTHTYTGASPLLSPLIAPFPVLHKILTERGDRGAPRLLNTYLPPTANWTLSQTHQHRIPSQAFLSQELRKQAVSLKPILQMGKLSSS